MRRRPRRPRRRWPGRRPAVVGGRAGVPPAIRHALQRARRLLDAGREVEAAAIYERLASRAYDRNRLRPGVQMDLEAARAWLRAERLDAAQARALHALDALLDRDRLPGLVVPIAARIADAMEAQGDPDAAAAFREQVEARLAAHEISLDETGGASGHASERRGRLPDQCPSCYAPLRTDEVTWLESDRAQCSYCGSVVLTE